MYGKKIDRMVVKVGSSTLAHENGNLNLRNMERLCRVLGDIKNTGTEVILVSSGAQAAGMGTLGLAEKPKELRLKQATAAVGQVSLMYTYDKLFGEYGCKIGQILLDRGDIDDEYHRQNLLNTFEALFEYGAVPIVNENDSVATEELGIGENDGLSAIVATLVHADILILLSDVNGLFYDDPHENPDARAIPVISDIDAVAHLAGGAGSNLGTGGMATKLSAAKVATTSGIDTVIIDGSDPSALYDILDGKPVGTLFVAKGVDA